jgi:disulfide bond formation protein DsbB
MIFKGSGDCSKVDWTFLSLSIANWSFLAFTAISLVALVLLRGLWRRRN